MRVILSGGGTAGHINPAIAIAQKLKKEDPNTEILFVGTPNGMEADLVTKAGFDFASVEVQGIRRKLSPQNILRNVKAVKCAVAAGPRVKRIIQSFHPDLVIGTGGYVSGPVVRKAAQMGIVTAIHEQNAFPGVTNKLLAKNADLVFLAVEKAKEHLPGAKRYAVVGNPIRENILMQDKASARQQLGLDDRFCIVSFGGSLGARKLSEIVADMMEWHAQYGDVNHIHAMGRLGKENFPQLLQERGVDPTQNPRLDIRDYIDNMDLCMAAADLIVCRAGALTLSELQATGTPAILIPSPNVTENHQYHNAMVLAEHGAAIVIEEKSYKKAELFEILDDFYHHPEKLETYSRHAYEMAIFDTSDRIYREIQTFFAQKAE